MAERWPELERGTPAVETKRKHLTPQWYKKVTAMDAKLEKLETALNGINVLNAGKKREEAVETFKQLLPEVESFQAETQRLREVAAAAQHRQQRSEKEVADLQAELREERNFSFQQRAHISVLESRCRKAEKLLKMLPPEVVREVERREKQAERLSR